jgi:hypothetical protein
VRLYSDGLEPHNARGGSVHIEKLQKMGSPSPIYAQKQGSWLSMESSQRISLSGTSSRVPPGMHRVRCNNLPTVLYTYPWMPVDVYAKACNIRVNCQAVPIPYVLTNCTVCVSLKCSKCGRTSVGGMFSWI